jgi:hypothetical protein
MRSSGARLGLGNEGGFFYRRSTTTADAHRGPRLGGGLNLRPGMSPPYSKRRAFPARLLDMS